MAQAVEHKTFMPSDAEFEKHLAGRQRRGRLWQFTFMGATLLTLLVLLILMITIIDRAYGLVAVRYQVDPHTLSETPLSELSSPELAAILAAPYSALTRQGQTNETELSTGALRSIVLTRMIGTVDPALLGTARMSELIEGEYSEEIGAKTYGELTREDVVALLGANVSPRDLEIEILERISAREVLKAWGWLESTFNRAAIEAEVGTAEIPGTTERLEGSELEYRSWLNADFLSGAMARKADQAGIRSGLIGSLWVVGITMLLAVPIGVGAATYLEEYAGKNWFNRLIETNIRNLAGVPSIIYGLLGLAIFSNIFRFYTSGDFLEGSGGQPSPGNTILSASLTMALLILPYIIATAQEAIRSVPQSFREASYGLGATKWQTVSRQVLPNALPGIITGVILSLSRAVGETAPLVVIGAAVFLSQDPASPFSQFTVLPIQIFNWIKEADPSFRFTASAGIIVLMVFALSLNSLAIILRNRLSRRL